MKNQNIAILVAILLAFNFVTKSDSGGTSQDNPTIPDRESSLEVALAEARLQLKSKTEDNQFVDLDITPDIQIPEELEEETPELDPNYELSKKYWEVMLTYESSGGRPWIETVGGRRSTGSRLQQHVAEHLGTSVKVFGNWGDRELELLHGWAHETEKGRASSDGTFASSSSRKTNTVRYSTQYQQNCPTGNCPNTRWTYR